MNAPLWDRYVFRRGREVFDLWAEMHKGRAPKLLYIAGGGFDVRVTSVLSAYLESCRSTAVNFESASLLLFKFTGYDLDEALIEQTAENSAALSSLFGNVGRITEIGITLASRDQEFRVAHSLMKASREITALLPGVTDIVLDVSSLPRVVYLALLTAVLDVLVKKGEANPLSAAGVNFQIVAAEDARLDGLIKSEDPSEDLVMIPGFGGGIKVEAMSSWPVVWFPVLGEGRSAQFDKVAQLAEIPEEAEVCPVLPHPSRNPRRGDQLLVEYRQQLFNSRSGTQVSNVMYAHESHPFEAYRQLRRAIDRYRISLGLLGGCRILVTPLSSKLMTIACGLACFEMKPEGCEDPNYAVGIPCAAPTRYVAARRDLLGSNPELTALVLTGVAYEP